MSGPVVLVGTRAGAFILRGDRIQSGPHFPGAEVSDLSAIEGRLWAAVGEALRTSDDGGRAWRAPAGRLRAVRRVCRVEPGAEAGTILAGVEEAALLMSRDGGATWSEASALARHPTRARWLPEAGGLSLGTILVAGARMWAAVSAGGLFRSDDGGATWRKQDVGIPPIDLGSPSDPDRVRCVHKVVLDLAGRLFRQDHAGLFRSDDGGDSWTRVNRGLPSDYGFALARGAAGDLFVAPLAGSEDRTPPGGALTVYRSRDAGESWRALTRGLPREHYHAGVLRDALAADPMEPAVLYLGTSAGHVLASADGGDSWRRLPLTLPRILSVRVGRA